MSFGWPCHWRTSFILNLFTFESYVYFFGKLVNMCYTRDDHKTGGEAKFFLSYWWPIICLNVFKISLLFLSSWLPFCCGYTVIAFPQNANTTPYNCIIFALYPSKNFFIYDYVFNLILRFHIHFEWNLCFSFHFSIKIILLTSNRLFKKNFYTISLYFCQRFFLKAFSTGAMCCLVGKINNYSNYNLNLTTKKNVNSRKERWGRLLNRTSSSSIKLYVLMLVQ